MLKIFFLLTCCAFVLSACTTVYTPVDAKKSPVTTRGMMLSPNVNWSKLYKPAVNSNVADLWTIDGLMLNQLYIFGEVKEGDKLFNKINDEIVLPSYQVDMLPNEITELLVSSLNNQYGGDLTIDTANLRPNKFGSKPGFSFEVNFFNKDGLYIKGKAFSAVVDSKLYLLLYMAPDLHYYEKNINNINTMVSEIKFI